MTDEDREAHEAFEEYKRLKLIADTSLNYTDGSKAAAAWVRFLNCFLPPEERMSKKVVPLSRRMVQ